MGSSKNSINWPTGNREKRNASVRKWRDLADDMTESHRVLEFKRVEDGRDAWPSYGSPQALQRENREDEGATIWGEFSMNVSGSSEQAAVIRSVNEKIRLYHSQGISPTFLELAGAAAAGVPGVKTICNTLERHHLKDRKDKYSVIPGDLTRSSTRGRILSAVRAQKPLVFVRLDPIAALDRKAYVENPLVRLKMRTLLLQLFEELDEGGVIWLPDIYARDLAPLARIIRSKGARIHSFLEDRNLLIEKKR